MNIDLEKLEKEMIPFEDIVLSFLKTSEDQKLYLNIAIEEYLEDGDFKSFFRSLETVIKARNSVSDFSKNVDINRAHLYDMFKGEKVPRLDTVGKILKELGYSLKIA